MASLNDIVPPIVEVSGIRIRGVSGRNIAYLVERFPDLKTLLIERYVDPQRLIEIAPDAIAAILAAGIGKAGDPNEESLADSLPVGLQVEFLSAIFRVTLPNGLAAVVEEITAALGITPDDLASADPALTDQDSNLPRRSSISNGGDTPTHST